MTKGSAGFWVVAVVVASCARNAEPSDPADAVVEPDSAGPADAAEAAAQGGAESFCADCDDCACDDGRTVSPPGFCGRQADLPQDLCDCERACRSPVRLSCDCGGDRSALLPAYCAGVEGAEDYLCACNTVCDPEANDCRILPEPQAGLPRCPEPSRGVSAGADVEWGEEIAEFYEEVFRGEVEATATDHGFELRPIAADAEVVRAVVSAGGLAWHPQLTPPLTLSVREDRPWWSELAVDLTDANGLVFATRRGSFSGMLAEDRGPLRVAEGEATCVGFSGHSGYVPDEAHRMDVALGDERWTVERGTQGERDVGGERYLFGLSVADQILDHCTSDMPSSWIDFFILRL